jgi:DeoR family transcriptional regulator, fructose operon transcriptional repressor
MELTAVLTEERQKAIQAYLAKKGNASVAELYKLFDVSEMTIRRDLKDLEKKGLLRRTYGGAFPTETAFFEMSFQAKFSIFTEEKKAIGRLCAEMVQDGDVIFLDSGTTTLEVAKNIANKSIIVITNDLNICHTLINYSNINLFISGGELRRGMNNLIGTKALSFYDGIQGKKLFMGVEGVNVEAGYTIPYLEEVLIKKRMMKSVEEVIVVADKSKLGRHTLGVIAPLNAAHRLVTDSGAPEELLQLMREQVTVLQAQVKPVVISPTNEEVL